MKFIVLSRYNSKTIGAAIGQPEYSYYFVLKEFIPLLERLGSVHIVGSEDEIDRVYEEIVSKGEQCYFLHFTAPHNVARETSCQAIPVFAWEFETIPDEAWQGDGYNNWKLPLRKCGMAITHSQYTVKAVKSALGSDFPVIAIPAPVWDRCANNRERLHHGRRRCHERSILLEFYGVLCDSYDIYFEDMLEEAFEQEQELDDPPVPEKKSLRFRLGMAKNRLIQIYHESIQDLLPVAIRRFFAWICSKIKPIYRGILPSSDDPQKDTDKDRKNIVEVSGVVYTTLFNPSDGRKNWKTMLTAFCWAFREVKDATLLIKVSSNNVVFFTDQVIEYLKRLRPFKCRIVIIKGFLEKKQYSDMLNATSYYVNTSYGEGQCLPLMEFLSSGIPAIAPNTTALADYMSDEVGFVLNSHKELTSWQHDERLMLRTFHYRVDWESTVHAFEQSYRTIKQDDARYRAMADAAIQNMQNHCSIDVLQERLKLLLK